MMHRESDFEAVALPFLDGLYRTAFRMVHDQGIAEHSVEQAYVEARHSFHQHTAPAACRVRLFAILFRNLRNRRKAWLHIKGWLTRAQATPDERVDAEPDDAPVQDEMLQALDRLPVILREVILLAEVEEFRTVEIEEILEIPAELVASRLAEGRTRLQQGLGAGRCFHAPFTQNPAVT